MGQVVRLKPTTKLSRSTAGKPPKPPKVERDYLTADELRALFEAAKKHRHGARDYCLLLTTFRHALRASEACALAWERIDLKAHQMHVKRSKHGKPSIHTIRIDEARALARLQPDPAKRKGYVFLSERGDGPITRQGFHRLLYNCGIEAGIGPVWPHRLRHSKGHELATRGIDTRRIQDFLGHRSIQSTARYTDLAPDALKDL